MAGRLLAAGADPNIALPSGETPLMTAARAGNADLVRALINHRADVNAFEQSQQQTVLMWAIVGRHPGIVRLLIDAGADIRARSAPRPRWINTEFGGFNGRTAREIEKGGFTPLLFACQQGDLESLTLLVNAGASVNDAAADGTTALVVAAHSGHGQIGAFLLERGADPNAADAGYTALHAAILRGDSTLVAALLAKGADPNVPLRQATPIRRNSADYSLENDVVEATPFWLAARYVEAGIMRLLVARGAETRFVMRDGTTPAMAAIQARRRVEPGVAVDPLRNEQLALDAVSVALDAGGNVNAVNKAGNTALHVAAQRRLDRIVQFLVERGAAVDVKNEKGQTPLAVAAAAPRPGAARAPGTKEGNSTADLLKKLGATE
jgi:ankyrin repeat protein